VLAFLSKGEGLAEGLTQGGMLCGVCAGFREKERWGSAQRAAGKKKTKIKRGVDPAKRGVPGSRDCGLDFLGQSFGFQPIKCYLGHKLHLLGPEGKNLRGGKQA